MVSNTIEDYLQRKLDQREHDGNLRTLRSQPLLYDFVSNDYLGLSRNKDLFAKINERVAQENVQTNGSGGSRLLAGNHVLTEQLERKLASIFNSDGSLLFNSGYNANLSLLSSVASSGDTIIYDQLSHVCLKEGAWLSKAESIKFKHNDCSDLEKKLSQASGNKFIVTESVFSMDGDFCPIDEIISISKKYDANIIVDEAHSTGCFGNGGNGWLCEKGIENEIFARVHTFGKALGTHGACVAGSKTLINYLINFGRPFIYTTALPLQSILSIEEAFNFISKDDLFKDELRAKITLFQRLMKENLDYEASETAIQPVIIPDNKKIKSISLKLNEKGFDVRPILAPTVPSGEERLRISLHSFNSNQEITDLVNLLASLI